MSLSRSLGTSARGALGGTCCGLGGCRSVRRTRERRRAANLRALPIDGPAAPDDLLTLADRDQLERGFRRLPPEHRAILVLHHYEGYAPSEIAEILGIPAGTARSRLHHAHRAMRAALDADARVVTAGGPSA